MVFLGTRRHLWRRDELWVAEADGCHFIIVAQPQCPPIIMKILFNSVSRYFSSVCGAKVKDSPFRGNYNRGSVFIKQRGVLFQLCSIKSDNLSHNQNIIICF